MTLYQVFDLPEDVKASDLKTRYKKLVKKYHPDKNKNDPNAEERFKIISNAYGILSDPNKRYLYDQKLIQERYSQSYSVGSYDDYQYQYGENSKSEWFDQERKKDLDLDRKTNIWILAGLILMSLLTFLGPKVVDHYKEQELAVLAAQKLQTQNEIIRSVQSHKVEEGIQLLEKYKAAFPNDLETINMENTLFDFVEMESNQLVQQENYRAIIPLVQPLLTYSGAISSNYYYLLSNAYYQSGEFEKATQVLETMLMDHPGAIRAKEELGKMYLDKRVDDPARALSYYDDACNQVIQHYTDLYGSAYIMLLDPNELPEIHARVFAGRAEALVKMGKYSLAMNDCKWALWLRPTLEKGHLLQTIIEQNLKANEGKQMARIQ
jgi:hypothetical protein